MLPKISHFWLKFECQLSKYLVLELTGKHFSSSEHIYWKHIGIFPNLHFSEQRIMFWLKCISITSKMWRLKSQFKTLPTQRLSFFLPILIHFWIINQFSSPTLGVCCMLYTIGWWCYAKWLKQFVLYKSN